MAGLEFRYTSGHPHRCQVALAELCETPVNVPSPIPAVIGIYIFSIYTVHFDVVDKLWVSLRVSFLGNPNLILHHLYIS